MKTFIINLGLGNSPYEASLTESKEQISYRRSSAHNALALLLWRHRVKAFYEWAEGEYEGKPEETMVITVTAKSVDVAHEFATDLVTAFTQQCVAIYDVESERGDLVWSSDVDDRPYTFDPSFFIMPTTVRDRIMAKLPKG